jgi:ADP-heptose:LPS heptosyltransferase
MAMEQRHILVIRLSAMGDVAMTIPVLRAFTLQYPEVALTVVTKAFFKPFFRDLKGVTIVIADVKGVHKGVFGLYKLAKTLHKQAAFYAIADLHNVLRSKILKQFVKAKQYATIDKGRSEKKKLTSGALFKQLKPTTQRYADVFKTLGYPVQLKDPVFPGKIILNETLQLFVSGPFPTSIGVAPFAAHKGKMYPITAMETVIAALSKICNVVLFGGGASEVEQLGVLEERYDNVTSVAGKLSLAEELDVISNLELMVAMDSGNAHIAAMLGLKVVTIWGVTHPYAGFAPFHQPEDYMLLANREDYPLIPTSIYGNTYPEGYETAAASIAPEAIILKVQALLGL